MVLNSHLVSKRLYRFISVMAKSSEDTVLRTVQEPELTFEDVLTCTITALGLRDLKP